MALLYADCRELATGSGVPVANIELVSSFVSRYAWWLLAAHGALASLLYSLAAHYPIRDPWVVPFWPLDARIPFVPWSAWVYASYVLLLPTLVLFGRYRPGFARVFVTGVTCALLNAVIYILFPTSLAARTQAPEGTLLAVIQTLDTTLCALPSGHVALPTALTIATALVAREGLRHALIWGASAKIFAVWTVALAVSTLLTKQHHLIDVVAGGIYGAAAALAAARLMGSQHAVRWPSSTAPSRAGLDEAA
jgi:membrane-associated phospholipid phosphatase